MSDHTCQARPGEDRCFVCRANLTGPLPTEHVRKARQYGDDVVQECSRCAVEWPCPAIKAITRNAARSRRARAVRAAS